MSAISFPRLGMMERWNDAMAGWWSDPFDVLSGVALAKPEAPAGGD
ncbi:MAG: hypothetical protein LLF89_06085 [Spirochaetaceae bacterium]|nr:hypothetical protein [Spirochaetaceae bacterium]